MPNPIAIFIKGLFLLAVAGVCFEWAKNLDTVELTRIADGRIMQVKVSDDDRIYGNEIDAARKRALPFYGATALFAIIGVSMLGKSSRVARKRRAAAEQARKGYAGSSW